MSHFYASIHGPQKTPKTARGFKTTGLVTHTRGWASGVKVEATYNEKLNRDEFHIYRTSGSNMGNNDLLIMVLSQDGIELEEREQ